MMNWEHEKIETNAGLQGSVAPTIISASRATDIPAFYPEWMLDRLRAGYCVWINPFNQHKQYISFKKCKVIVFWSKNPAPLIPLLPQIDDMGLAYYFQFTINDYVAERLEPGLPSLEHRIETFVKLSEIVGKERIIWRFDPILISSTMSIECILDRINNIASKLCNYTDKLVFSFADIECYKNVQKNIRSLDSTIIEPSINDMKLFAKRLSDNNDSLYRPLTIATCAEKINLFDYGIQHNRCIDGQLISKILLKSKHIVEPTKQIQISLFNECDKISETDFQKDKGQRRECLCIASKDIGAYNTCQHMCVYCYANSTQKRVASNVKKMIRGNEALLS